MQLYYQLKNGCTSCSWIYSKKSSSREYVQMDDLPNDLEMGFTLPELTPHVTKELIYDVLRYYHQDTINLKFIKDFTKMYLDHGDNKKCLSLQYPDQLETILFLKECELLRDKTVQGNILNNRSNNSGIHDTETDPHNKEEDVRDAPANDHIEEDDPQQIDQDDEDHIVPNDRRPRVTHTYNPVLRQCNVCFEEGRELVLPCEEGGCAFRICYICYAEMIRVDGDQNHRCPGCRDPCPDDLHPPMDEHIVLPELRYETRRGVLRYITRYKKDDLKNAKLEDFAVDQYWVPKRELPRFDRPVFEIDEGIHDVDAHCVQLRNNIAHTNGFVDVSEGTNYNLMVSEQPNCFHDPLSFILFRNLIHAASFIRKKYQVIVPIYVLGGEDLSRVKMYVARQDGCDITFVNNIDELPEDQYFSLIVLGNFDVATMYYLLSGYLILSLHGLYPNIKTPQFKVGVHSNERFVGYKFLHHHEGNTRVFVRSNRTYGHLTNKSIYRYFEELTQNHYFVVGTRPHYYYGIKWNVTYFDDVSGCNYNMVFNEFTLDTFDDFSPNLYRESGLSFVPSPEGGIFGLFGIRNNRVIVDSRFVNKAQSYLRGLHGPYVVNQVSNLLNDKALDCAELSLVKEAFPNDEHIRDLDTYSRQHVLESRVKEWWSWSNFFGRNLFRTSAYNYVMGNQAPIWYPVRWFMYIALILMLYHVPFVPSILRAFSEMIIVVLGSIARTFGDGCATIFAGFIDGLKPLLPTLYSVILPVLNALGYAQPTPLRTFKGFSGILLEELLKLHPAGMAALMIYECIVYDSMYPIIGHTVLMSFPWYLRIPIHYLHNRFFDNTLDYESFFRSYMENPFDIQFDLNYIKWEHCEFPYIKEHALKPSFELSGKFFSRVKTNFIGGASALWLKARQPVTDIFSKGKCATYWPCSIPWMVYSPVRGDSQKNYLTVWFNRVCPNLNFKAYSDNDDDNNRAVNQRWRDLVTSHSFVYFCTQFKLCMGFVGVSVVENFQQSATSLFHTTVLLMKNCANYRYYLDLWADSYSTNPLEADAVSRVQRTFCKVDELMMGPFMNDGEVEPGKAQRLIANVNKKFIYMFIQIYKYLELALHFLCHVHQRTHPLVIHGIKIFYLFAQGTNVADRVKWLNEHRLSDNFLLIMILGDDCYIEGTVYSRVIKICTDFSKFDQTEGDGVLYMRLSFFEFIKLPDYLKNMYKKMHSGFLKIFMLDYWIRFKISCQRTGDLFTCFFNGLTNLVSLLFIIEQNPNVLFDEDLYVQSMLQLGLKVKTSFVSHKPLDFLRFHHYQDYAFPQLYLFLKMGCPKKNLKRMRKLYRTGKNSRAMISYVANVITSFSNCYLPKSIYDLFIKITRLCSFVDKKRLYEENLKGRLLFDRSDFTNDLSEVVQANCIVVSDDLYIRYLLDCYNLVSSAFEELLMMFETMYLNFISTNPRPMMKSLSFTKTILKTDMCC